ncbi:UNVERIFIED_CONTAM: hypothetical protein GTU68_005659 [Idotea baltica]|nr:hypothetical protein [Idotea baltica]
MCRVWRWCSHLPRARNASVAGKSSPMSAPTPMLVSVAAVIVR